MVLYRVFTKFLSGCIETVLLIMFLMFVIMFVTLDKISESCRRIQYVFPYTECFDVPLS